MNPKQDKQQTCTIRHLQESSSGGNMDLRKAIKDDKSVGKKNRKYFFLIFNILKIEPIAQ